MRFHKRRLVGEFSLVQSEKLLVFSYSEAAAFKTNTRVLKIFKTKPNTHLDFRRK